MDSAPPLLPYVSSSSSSNTEEEDVNQEFDPRFDHRYAGDLNRPDLGTASVAGVEQRVSCFAVVIIFWFFGLFPTLLTFLCFWRSCPFFLWNGCLNLTDYRWLSVDGYDCWCLRTKKCLSWTQLFCSYWTKHHFCTKRKGCWLFYSYQERHC